MQPPLSWGCLLLPQSLCPVAKGPGRPLRPRASQEEPQPPRNQAPALGSGAWVSSGQSWREAERCKLLLPWDSCGRLSQEVSLVPALGCLFPPGLTEQRLSFRGGEAGAWRAVAPRGSRLQGVGPRASAWCLCESWLHQADRWICFLKPGGWSQMDPGGCCPEGGAGEVLIT